MVSLIHESKDADSTRFIIGIYRRQKTMTDTWQDHDLYLSCIKVINSWPQEVWEQAAKAISEDIDKQIIKSCTN
jgi:hypothetical protein